MLIFVYNFLFKFSLISEDLFLYKNSALPPSKVSMLQRNSQRDVHAVLYLLPGFHSVADLVVQCSGIDEHVCAHIKFLSYRVSK